VICCKVFIRDGLTVKNFILLGLGASCRLLGPVLAFRCPIPVARCQFCLRCPGAAGVIRSAVTTSLSGYGL
jgi:hypothetical protein